MAQLLHLRPEGIRRRRRSVDPDDRRQLRHCPANMLSARCFRGEHRCGHVSESDRTIRVMAQTSIWTGDPVWIADVLRAEGVNLVEYPGWRNRGHGDFKDIRGVMVHHTGSDNATAASIANGRPDLPGPVSQLHIARDGTVTVVAVGVAWHAGVGMYPWLPTNMGNWHMIGIECANTGTSPTAAHRTNWPDAQYFALVNSCAAINRRLGQTSARTIGHKEYAGRAQGKWDPGAINMDILRADIQARIGTAPGTAPTPRPPVPVGMFADVLLYRGSEGPLV